MSETIDNVSERLTRLEVTVAQGFHDCAKRDDALSRKIDTSSDALNRKIDSRTEVLSRKIDASTDAVREDLRTLREEMQRTNDSIRDVLVDHSHRLKDLEGS